MLYAQPLTRTAALKTTDIARTSDDQITLRLARAAVPPPEPLGSLAHALRYQRLASNGSDGWLLPGRKTGTHITAEQLRERLKRYGIASRPARHAALLALAAGCPPRSSPSGSASTRHAPRNGFAPPAPRTATNVALRQAP